MYRTIRIYEGQKECMYYDNPHYAVTCPYCGWESYYDRDLLEKNKRVKLTCNYWKCKRNFGAIFIPKPLRVLVDRLNETS